MDKQEAQLSKYTTYTIDDVANILLLSSSTIRRLMKQPDFIPSFKIGGSIWFIKEDVLNWMDVQKTRGNIRYKSQARLNK